MIDGQGKQVGIVETKQAMQMAREAGLDLVEVAPQSRPPVCRIMDYGKFKYDEKKKERKAKAHRHETELKVMRIRTPKIGDHDLEIKIQHAREFLARGDRVQFTMWFRGREMAHQDIGREVLNSVKKALADVAKLEHDFSMEGRALSILFGPVGKVATAKKPPKPKPDAKPGAAPQPAQAGVPAAPPATAPSAPAVATATTANPAENTPTTGQ